MDYEIIVTELSLRNNKFVFFLKTGAMFIISSIDISNILSISLEEFDKRLAKCLNGNVIKHVFIEDTPEMPSHCLSFNKLQDEDFYKKAFEEEFEKELILLKLS